VRSATAKNAYQLSVAERQSLETFEPDSTEENDEKDPAN